MIGMHNIYPWVSVNDHIAYTLANLCMCSHSQCEKNDIFDGKSMGDWIERGWGDSKNCVLYNITIPKNILFGMKLLYDPVCPSLTLSVMHSAR